MTLMREYYRGFLSAEGKKFYDLILRNIRGLAIDGEITLHGLFSQHDLEDASKAYMALRDDRPEFYFMDNQVQVILSFPGRMVIKQKKRFTFDQIKRINNILRKSIAEILEINNSKSVIDIERQIYRKIATSYTYRAGVYSHDLSGLLVYKEGVCESLSGILVVALREAGIPAAKVRGFAKNEPHCWTKVQINGQEYHLDVTWDMEYAKLSLFLRYFNVSEKKILRDHVIESPGYSVVSTHWGI